MKNGYTVIILNSQIFPFYVCKIIRFIILLHLENKEHCCQCNFMYEFKSF